ncbi:ferredoxin [Streptomyces fimicarius]|uniref:ferredoxin n=1 Tax=Streptomyces griseus TaxID=1911 RepID=UPI0036BE906C
MASTDQVPEAGRVGVERGRCVGAGQCVLAAPAVFDQDEQDGLVLVLDEEPAASQSEAVHHAVWVCPSGALTFR